MSRKSRREKEMLIQERQQEPKGPQVIYGQLPGMHPIAPPAKIIQLTPIIQPIALVPYSTQEQPICTVFDDYDGYDY